MGNTKRFISALMTVIMTAGFFVYASAEETEQAVRSTGAYELQVLSDLEVIGRDAALFRQDKAVNRAQFAYVMAGFMGYKRTSALVKSEIDDVEPEYMYAQSIKYLIDNGIMKLDGEGRFRPEKELTYREAVQAFIAMLGYASRAEVYGGTWNDFLRVGREIGLLHGAADAGKIKITYAELIGMFYDSLEIPLLEVTSVADKNGEVSFGYSNSAGRTPLDLWHNISVIKGRLTNIERGTTVLDNEEFPPDIARIDGYTFKVGNTDADAYIGYSVKAYYNKEERILESIIPDVAENDVLRIEAEDIIGYKDGVLTYSKNGRNAKVSIPAASGVVYNGAAVPAEKWADVLTPEDGYIIINRFSGGNTEQLTLITEYKTYIVGAKSIDYIIYDKLTEGNGVSLDPDKVSVKIRDEGGKLLTFEDIAEGDVLSLAISLNNERVRGDRSKADVTGTLTKSMSRDGREYIAVDDAEYMLSKSYKASGKPLPRLGTYVTVLIDSFGKAADVEAADKSQFKYGFLKEVCVRDEVFSSKLLVRIFDGSTVKSYTCAEKLSVDNYRTMNAEDAIAAVKKGQPADLNRVYQPIRFCLNEDNEVSVIDTAYYNEAADESEDSLRYIYRGNNPYDLGRGTALRLEAQSGFNFGQKFITYSSNLRYTVPVSPDSEDEYFRGYISLWTDGSFIVDALTSRKNSLTAELVVSYKNADAATSVETKYGFVTDICEVLNSNDEITHKISYIDSEGKEGSMNTRSRSLVNEADSNEGRGVYTVTKGDFIRFERNGREEVADIKMIYDAESKKWLNNTDYVGSFAYHIINYGFVLQKDSGIIRVGTQKPKSEEEMLTQSAVYINTAPSAVYIWDSETETVTKTTSSELLSYAQSGDACSEIVTAGYNGITRVIAIYK